MKEGNIETAEKYKADATFLNFEVLGDEAQRKKQREEKEIADQTELERKESMFKQVLEIDSEDAMAGNGMGDIELIRGNFEKAQMHFENAIKGNAKYSVAYLGLAKSLYNQNKMTKLKETLDLGISVASKNGDLMPANEMQSMLLGILK